MIYFLLNNNYQRYDFMLHLDKFDLGAVSVIEIPHKLDSYPYADSIKTFRYEQILGNGLINQVSNYLSVSSKMKNEIKPTGEDVLFLYTEFEILNLYLVDLFKKSGARIYLIEDGGMATYIPFRKSRSESLSIKERVKLLIYRALPGLINIRFQKMNGVVFPWLPDKTFNGLCVYRPVRIFRKIPVILIVNSVSLPAIDVIKDRVIFLNEPIYDHYQDEVKYFSGLIEILRGLEIAFREVYFKFHPRETIEWRQRIKDKVLFYYPDIVVIESNDAFESMVETYRPSTIASYFAASLLNLCVRGIEPMYLYRCIPDLNCQPVFQEVSLVLSELGYNFITQIAEIRSGYKSGLLGEGIGQDMTTLFDLVAKY
jgi:hypothetical protein